jgi:hypothetical protein
MIIKHTNGTPFNIKVKTGDGKIIDLKAGESIEDPSGIIKTKYSTGSWKTLKESKIKLYP